MRGPVYELCNPGNAPNNSALNPTLKPETQDLALPKLSDP